MIYCTIDNRLLGIAWPSDRVFNVLDGACSACGAENTGRMVSPLAVAVVYAVTWRKLRAPRSEAEFYPLSDN